MVDLSVRLKNFDCTLEHPLMNGGGLCKTLEDVKEMSRTGLAGIEVGSYTVLSRLGNSGSTFGGVPGLCTLNSWGIPNPGKAYLKSNGPEMVKVARGAGK